MSANERENFRLELIEATTPDEVREIVENYFPDLPPNPFPPGPLHRAFEAAVEAEGEAMTREESFRDRHERQGPGWHEHDE